MEKTEENGFRSMRKEQKWVWIHEEKRRKWVWMHEESSHQPTLLRGFNGFKNDGKGTNWKHISWMNELRWRRGSSMAFLPSFSCSIIPKKHRIMEFPELDKDFWKGSECSMSNRDGSNFYWKFWKQQQIHDSEAQQNLCISRNKLPWLETTRRKGKKQKFPLKPQKFPAG